MASLLCNPTEEDQEVTLHVKIEKTVTLKVKSSEKIRNIKALVKDREDAVPANLQELVISGNKLKDEDKLSDYITVGDSFVDIVCQENTIKISVKRISTGGIVSTDLQVKMNDTIKLVKFMIDTREGTISDVYKLIFDGEQLQDCLTIAGSGLKNDSVLYMMICPKDTLPLQIAMPCGRIERITVKTLNTIFDLRVVLQTYIEMPIDQWHLASSDEALGDLETVAYHRLEADTLLHVMLPSVQIFVRIPTGEQIALFIKLTDDVLSIKEQIFKKTGYPVEYQSLIFSGRVLEDSQRIVTYGIQKDSTIQQSVRSSVYCKHGTIQKEPESHGMLPIVQIFVRIPSGKQIAMFIKLTDDVLSLKEQIFKITSHCVEYQSLVFSGRVLEDSEKIAYWIEKDSTIHLSVSPNLRPKQQKKKTKNKGRSSIVSR